jgi:DNA-binding transcriptional regulator WhiA
MALGDGNLSNPNGRAIRLRITCDNTYLHLISEVVQNITELFPHNKVALISRKDNCTDISLYSNKLADIMPWRFDKGSKYDQQAHVPAWVKCSHYSSEQCLRGLILSDGSIYKDRGYIMVNFTTNIYPLAKDVVCMLKNIGFTSSLCSTKQPSGRPKYTVRVAKNASKLVQHLRLEIKCAHLI